MKKLTMVALSTLLCVAVLAGCKGESGSPLAYDDQINADGSFNENLFYRNDLETRCADPQVIYIDDADSSEKGYYYMFATSDYTMWVTGFTAWRSKDLEHWENVSALKGYPAFLPTEEHFGFSDYWAPEVVYDRETDKYYMYYSCTPVAHSGENWKELGLAIADEPYGPYLALEDDTHDASTPFFDQEKMMAAAKNVFKAEGLADEDGGYVGFTTIDASPFVAADGTKYLFFNRDGDGSNKPTRVWGMKMKSWTEPDYGTLVHLTENGFYSIEDYKKSLAGEEVERVEYESTTTRINEGPFVYEIKNDDGSSKFFLTFSINGYNDKTYAVAQAASDSPLGPYTKLRREDGGLILAVDNQSWDHISGPGHHCFFMAGDELMIVYHEHVDRENGKSQRAVAFDRVKIVENNKGEKVLYVNGPTWSLQPRLESVSEYRNIAPDAKLKSTSGENLSAVNDGLLSMYSYIDYVKEYETEKRSTITLTFEDYREVTGLMIYNSKKFEYSFMEVSRIEIDFEGENGKKQTAYIEHLAFNWDMYKDAYSQIMRPGGSSVALFVPLMVKEIRITIDPAVSRELDGDERLVLTDEEGYFIQQSKVAISEIVVLGK